MKLYVCKERWGVDYITQIELHETTVEKETNAFYIVTPSPAFDFSDIVPKHHAGITFGLTPREAILAFLIASGEKKNELEGEIRMLSATITNIEDLLAKYPEEQPVDEQKTPDA